MNAAVASFRGRLDEIRSRIARSAERSGRASTDIALIGVVKTVPPEIVREAVQAGLRDLAENRVQEAERKIPEVEGDVRWHLVGHLQRNKAARAVALFQRLHGIDDFELAEAISRRALERGTTIRALVQVNVSGEATKFGVEPDALEALLEQTRSLPGVRIDGLMSIAPLAGGMEAARRCFAETRELRDRAERSLGVALPELSMGMTADFECAVEEGSTMVRIGTALFGGHG